MGDKQEVRNARVRHRLPTGGEKWVQGYNDAVRANRQLATVLRNQGLNEDPDRFAYRAQNLQRQVLRRQHNMSGYSRARKTAVPVGHADEGACVGFSQQSYRLPACR